MEGEWLMSFLRREQMDCCNYVEAMGSKILVNSKSNWMHLESLEGNTTQISTTGAQLMNLSKLQRIYNGVNYVLTGDGGIQVSGNTIDNASNSAVASTNLSPGTYCVSGSVPIGNTKIFVKAKKWYSDGTSVVINDTSFIVDGTETKIDYFIQLKQGISEFSKIVYPMLNAGDTAKSWEPYTGEKPSPSVEYPQDFVGADIKYIEVQGAQLFDISNPYSSINQWVITNDTISITNPTDGYLTVIYKIDCKPNTTYTIYSIIVNDVPDSNSMHIAISLLKKDGTTQDNIVILNNTSSATFITTSDTQSIYIYFRNRTIGNGGYFKDIIVNEGKTALPWQPYYSPQNISITLTKPLYGIDNYNDEIAVTKRIDKCIEFTFNGSENWAVISTYKGFYYAGILPFTAMRRAGFCNQFPVDTKGEAIESIRIGNGNSVLFCVYSRFYDDTAADKGLAAWKAHLSTNPLKIVTYTNPEGYVETPLEQSNIDAIKSLYAYNGYTIVNNNENTNMKIMYKTKS